MKVLMVMTSHDKLGNTTRNRLLARRIRGALFPLHRCRRRGYSRITEGWSASAGSVSDTPEGRNAEYTIRFKGDGRLRPSWLIPPCFLRSAPKTMTQSSILVVMDRCGTLPESGLPIALIEAFHNSGKPVAAVCHAPGVLHRFKINGQPIVKGKRVTGFTNEEEEEVHLTHVVPFLVEDELKRLGGRFEKVANWQVFTVVDGFVITGQNPASSGPGAAELINLLKQRAVA